MKALDTDYFQNVNVKKKTYLGTVKKIETNKIYININHLEKGHYKLKIVHKNKVIKSTYFTKK